jgi:hypothetical protein
MENRTAQPMIITVENKTEKEIQDVILFGASNVFSNLFNKKDNFIEGLEIKSFIPNVEYSDIILKTITNPFNIQNIGFKINNRPDEFDLFIKTKDINGNVAQMNSQLNSDSKKEYGVEKGYDFYTERKFRIDAFTELIIPKILPKTKITIYIIYI